MSVYVLVLLVVLGDGPVKVMGQAYATAEACEADIPKAEAYAIAKGAVLVGAACTPEIKPGKPT